MGFQQTSGSVFSNTVPRVLAEQAHEAPSRLPTHCRMGEVSSCTSFLTTAFVQVINGFWEDARNLSLPYSPLPMGSYRGKTAFITGGARGIGAEVAFRLHDAGARVVVTDVAAPALAEPAGRLGDRRLLTVLADVRDPDAMAAAAERGARQFGGIDVVVANAG